MAIIKSPLISPITIVPSLSLHNLKGNILVDTFDGLAVENDGKLDTALEPRVGIRDLILLYEGICDDDSVGTHPEQVI